MVYGIMEYGWIVRLLRIATMNGVIVATGKHVLVMWDYTHSSMRGIR